MIAGRIALVLFDNSISSTYPSKKINVVSVKEVRSHRLLFSDGLDRVIVF